MNIRRVRGKGNRRRGRVAGTEGDGEVAAT